MKRIVCLFSLLILIAFNTRASHIIGGEIYYDYLGNNNYRISIALFRDCASNGASFDTPLILTIFNAANQQHQNIQVPYPGSQHLDVVFNNPCVSAPSGICVERAIYTTTVLLPASPGGYTVSYQRCCRGPNVTNLDDPEDTGLTLTTHITGTNSNALVNSSPRFNNYPPLVLCNNDNLNFNHSATDPDGDVLVYELVTPYAGATGGAPAPNPIPPPPYQSVSWAPGFSAAGPLGTAANITINPNTGQLFADPEMLGLFVVGIRVKEYRNGVLIGETIRDFLFRVINCIISLEAQITPQEDMPTFVSYCEGTTITFENESFGGSSYAWDFGVPNITTDVSTAFEPTYTFPAPGIYQVRLIVNPGWPCTDTSMQTFQVYEHLNVSFTAQDSMCIVNNSFDFNGSFNGPAQTSFSWNFGPDASPPSATSLDVSNVSFSASGYMPVTLTGNYETCHKTFTDSVFVMHEAVADFTTPPNIECLGLTVHFTNASQSATVYEWDFGVAGSATDVSTAVNPSFTFPSGGTYTVRLIANSFGACSDTILKTLSVYDPLSVSFTHNDSLCITTNSFNFDGSMTGPDITTYQWNFGPNATAPSTTTLDVNNVVFSAAGIIPVTLTASHHGCTATATSNVTIFREPTIAFGIVTGLRCAPYDAYFTDSSTSDTPLTYAWNFGDGGTSSAQNPVHAYINAGTYTVTLSISTSTGCINTLSLSKAGFITIHPTPSAGFSISTALTDICHPEVIFTDHSSGGGDYIAYYFDDLNAYSIGVHNPVHLYLSSGQKRPRQVVINEYGCSDTSYQSLYVEPFSVFIPNAFTPDSDEFNGKFEPVAAMPSVAWRFRIYSRWGELLFESYDQSEGWDGSYRGRIVQDGIYVYILDYTSCAPQAESIQVTGHVSLLR